MTITATPVPGATPPRIDVGLSVTAGSVMQSVSLWRVAEGKRELVRAQPSPGFDSRVVNDYEAPYGVPVSYEWTTEYLDSSQIVQLWSEPWANLSAWTVVGASWSVVGGRLVWSAADNAAASVSRTVTAGRYQTVIAAPPVGISRVDFGGFYLDVQGKRLVVGTQSVAFVPGVGEWKITMTPRATSITTTAGSYSVAAGAVMDRVAFVGAVSSYSGPVSWSITGWRTSAVSVAPDGTVYTAQSRVTTTSESRIAVTDSAGTFLRYLGSQGTAASQFSAVGGLAVDASGNVFVSDPVRNRILKYGPTGTYVAGAGSTGAGASQFNGPSGIGVDSAGSIYVADLGNFRVQKLSNALAFTSRFGSQGTSNGRFSYPTDVTVDPSGNIYVADARRVQKFNSAFTYVSQLTQGTRPGQLDSWPNGVASDVDGVVYVALQRGIIRVNAAGDAMPTILPATGIQGNYAYAASIAVGGPNRSVFITRWDESSTPTGPVFRFDQFRASIAATTLSAYEIWVALSETSASVTLNSVNGWIIHPGKPSLSFRLGVSSKVAGIRTVETVENESTTTLHQIMGQSEPTAVSSGPRGSDRYSMTVAVVTVDERRALKAVLRDQTTLLIRVPPAWDIDFDDGFFSVGTTQTARSVQMTGANQRDVVLPLTAVRSPIVGVENATGWSWATLAAEFSSWDEVRARFATWADLAANNRGS